MINALFAAVTDKQNLSYDEINQFHLSNIDLLAEDEHGHTALMAAVAAGKKEMVINFLSTHFYDLNLRNSCGKTAYDVAIENKHYDISYLIQHQIEADRSLITSIDDKSCDGIRHYLEEGANPNIQNSKGWTALMTVVSEQNVEASSFVLEYFVNLNLRNADGMTAEDIFSNNPHAEIEELLKTKIETMSRHLHDVVETDELNPTIQLQLTKKLMEYGAIGDIALFSAILHHNLEVATTLLDHGARTDFRNLHGDTTAIVAAKIQQLEIFNKIISHSLKDGDLTNFHNTVPGLFELKADSISFFNNENLLRLMEIAPDNWPYTNAVREELINGDKNLKVLLRPITTNTTPSTSTTHPIHTRFVKNLSISRD